jgi:peptidoglycan/xylan/chitin deacetylase (PgdA/CDA1 family)
MNLRRSVLSATCLLSLSVLVHCSSDGAIGPIATGGDSGADSGHPGGGDSGGGDDGGNPGDDSGNPNPGGPLTGNGCAGGTCLNPDCKALGTPAPIGTAPETGFDPQPAFIPNDVIIPTFDDIPDGADSSDVSNAPGAWTKSDLKFFDDNGMHVDFFINTNNWCGKIDGSSNDDPDCQGAIVDVLMKHNPANHTIHHPHMGTPSTVANPTDDNPPDGCGDTASCNGELAGVEEVVAKLSNGGRPHLTRFRAPYGEPYQTADSAKLAIVAPVVAKYAVEVDWNLDDGDSTCNTPCALTGQNIADTVIGLIGTAPGQGQHHGILLMHGTYKWTRESLPILYGKDGYLAKHGFRLGTVEDAICWKYGKHSWDIVSELSGQKRDPN